MSSSENTKSMAMSLNEMIKSLREYQKYFVDKGQITEKTTKKDWLSVRNDIILATRYAWIDFQIQLGKEELKTQKEVLTKIVKREIISVFWSYFHISFINKFKRIWQNETTDWDTLLDKADLLMEKKNG